MTDIVDLSPEQVRDQRRAAKRIRNRFNVDNAPPALKTAGVAEEWWPTKAGFQFWWNYIIPSLGVTPEGYWYAHCPLHDSTGTDENATALISFKDGVVKCLQIDGDCHKGKRAMSLNNAALAMRLRAADVDGDLG